MARGKLGQALELVTTRFAETVYEYGPDATAVFCCAKATNEDNYVLQKMFRAVIGTNNIDHCTRLCHAGSVVALQMAVGSSAMSNTGSDIYDCDVAIVTGSNTAESHPIIALQFKDAVKHHGTQLIVADPRRIGIFGASNGGLLVAVALVQRPDLFAAAVCTVPLTDMLRYHRFLIARLWINEYGDPDDPAAAAFLRVYSPYHNVRERVPYPATFIVTAESDTRVDPSHARKFGARLQAATSGDDPILVYIESQAGHGIG